MIFVTGGAGFIGSNFVHEWLSENNESVLNLDLLTYAGHLENLATVMKDPRHIFVRGDINDRTLVSSLLKQYRPRAIVHFAAESHVDRSINSPRPFYETNVLGTLNLLESAKNYYDDSNSTEQSQFRFLHVSTDEVYGSLAYSEPAFTEESPYRPNSPYSASKASSDHTVRAWFHTYGFPTLTVNCSNNYGPYQFPEKLIPLVITNAIARKPLPIYGDGLNIRDWLYVSDHCAALRLILDKGKPGETYNVGGNSERNNITIVKTICAILDEVLPDPNGSYLDLITFVQDRPGHDRRYAINADKLRRELGWKPKENFESGIRKTVLWYLEHTQWIEHVIARNRTFIV
mgnify:CR=1 FL=1